MEKPQSLTPSSGEEKKNIFTGKLLQYFFLLIFFLPHIPDLFVQHIPPEKCSLDEGWVRVLNWAFANPSSTPELVFTYGPLGSLLVPLTLTSFLPGVLLSLGGAVLLKDLFHFKTKKEFFFLFLFLLLTLPLSWYEIFPLLFPFLLLERTAKEEKFHWKDGVFLTGGALFSALLVLGKFQYFPLLFLGFILSDLQLAFRKKLPFLSLSFFVFYVLFFYLAPTAKNSFVEYFRGSWEIMTGFQAAMVWFDASPFWLFLMLITAGGIFFTTAFFLWKAKEKTGIYYFLFLLQLAAGLFVSYKYGAVRGDAGHIGIALMLLALLAGFSAVRFTFLPLWVRSGFAGAGLFLLILVGYKNIQELPVIIWKRASLHHILTLSTTLQEYKALFCPLNNYTLEEGKGKSCDSLVPDGNGALFQSEFAFTPRPIFHNYSAYTPYLIEKNRSFLMGAKAPDYLLFRQDPPTKIAGTTPHPMLGDHSSMLLSGKYTFGKYWGKNLLLQKKKTPSPPRLMKMGQKEIAFGETLILPVLPPGTSLYCKITFYPTIAGELLKFLQRPTVPQMEILTEDEKKFLYDIPGRMGEPLFLLSPHLDDTISMEKYLKGEKLPGVKKIRFIADHRFFSRGKGGNPLDLLPGRLAMKNKIKLTFYKEKKP